MGGSGGLLQILTNIAQFFSSSGGGMLCVIAIAIAAVYSAFEHRLHAIGWTIAACAVLISASWIATTWLGATAV